MIDALPWHETFSGDDNRSARRNLKACLEAWFNAADKEGAIVEEEESMIIKEEDAEFQKRISELDFWIVCKIGPGTTRRQITDKDWPRRRRRYLSEDKLIPPAGTFMKDVRDLVLAGNTPEIKTLRDNFVKSFSAVFGAVEEFKRQGKNQVKIQQAVIGAEEKRKYYRIKLEKERALLDTQFKTDLLSIGTTCDAEFKTGYEKFAGLIADVDKRYREINMRLEAEFETVLKEAAAQEKNYIVHSKSRIATLRLELKGTVNAIAGQGNVGLKERLDRSRRFLAEFNSTVEELYTEPPILVQASAPKSSGS
jgi:hypothetical protein